MKIVFDMDNTLFDELGQQVRPGVVKLLERLDQPLAGDLPLMRA